MEDYTLNNFKGKAEKLTSGALATLSVHLGCEIATLRSIIQVETGGSGYDKQGRPKALFEPHIFYRLIADDKESLRRAIAEGVAYKYQGHRPYPMDSYPHIMAAMKINPAAALMATSWGLPQILGENFKECGYPSVLVMVLAFMAGEDGQVAAMAGFMRSAGLLEALRTRDWKRIERVYNGPLGWKHGYARRLAVAYRYERLRPTIAAAVPKPKPFSPEQHNSMTAASSTSASTVCGLGALSAAASATVVGPSLGSLGALGAAIIVGAVVVCAGLFALAAYFKTRSDRFSGLADDTKET